MKHLIRTSSNIYFILLGHVGTALTMRLKIVHGQKAIRHLLTDFERVPSNFVVRQSASHKRVLHQLAMRRSDSRKYGIIFSQQSRQIGL